jgi:hypothetical protein
VHEYGYAIQANGASFEFVRPDGRPVLHAPRLRAIEAERGCAELASGNADGEDGVEINPSTADSHWMGESLDYDWVLRRLFALDAQARLEAEREDPRSRGDERCAMSGER